PCARTSGRSRTRAGRCAIGLPSTIKWPQEGLPCKYNDRLSVVAVAVGCGRSRVRASRPRTSAEPPRKVPMTSTNSSTVRTALTLRWRGVKRGRPYPRLPRCGPRSVISISNSSGDGSRSGSAIDEDSFYQTISIIAYFPRCCRCCIPGKPSCHCSPLIMAEVFEIDLKTVPLPEMDGETVYVHILS